MNINLKNRRPGKWAINLRWAAALALAGAVFSGTSAAAADTPGNPGVAFANSEEQEQQRADAEHRAALIVRADASDRHLQTLADAAEQRARALQAQGSDQHLENLAEQERVLQAQGSDQHLENLAEQADNHSPQQCAE